MSVPPIWVCIMCHPGPVSYAGKVIGTICSQCKAAMRKAEASK